MMNKCSEGVYTSDLQKTAAVVTEMMEVLSLWEPEMSLDDLERRVIDAGALGRVSATRVRDIVKRSFNQRFLVPDDGAARNAKAILERGLGAVEFREVLFLYCVRTYLSIYDFLVERYWPAAFAGHETITGSQIILHLKDKFGTGRNPAGWSESVTARVARNLGKALSDFGLFESRRTTVRRIRPYQPSDFLVLFLFHEAHEAGMGDTVLLGLAEWEALGMGRSDVVDRARYLADVNGAFLFQYSGELAQFSWRHQTVKEFVDAYTPA
jgi:hypothetical protein